MCYVVDVGLIDAPLIEFDFSVVGVKGSFDEEVVDALGVGLGSGRLVVVDEVIGPDAPDCPDEVDDELSFDFVRWLKIEKEVVAVEVDIGSG